MRSIAEGLDAWRKRTGGLNLQGRTSLEIAPTQRDCTNCGQPFEARYLPQYVCPRCVENDRRLTAEQYRAERAIERTAALERVGLAGALQRMTLDTFDRSAQPAGYAAVRGFVDDYPQVSALALLGAIGAGKSHLAAGAVIALAERNVTARFCHLPTLTNRLRQASDWQKTATELVAPLFEVDVLVLDDFGREKETPSLPEMLDALIDRRWLERAPTIITANLTRAKFKERLGPASASRFLSEAVVVEVRGDDWRQSGRGQLLSTTESDPKVACATCQGAGWVLNGAVPVVLGKGVLGAGQGRV